jgi:hypothetical protein
MGEFAPVKQSHGQAGRLLLLPGSRHPDFCIAARRADLMQLMAAEAGNYGLIGKRR